MEYTWDKIYNSNMAVGKVRSIFDVNRFVWENTSYPAFCFNGFVFRVSSPENFSWEGNKLIPLSEIES